MSSDPSPPLQTLAQQRWCAKLVILNLVVANFCAEALFYALLRPFV